MNGEVLSKCIWKIPEFLYFDFKFLSFFQQCIHSPTPHSLSHTPPLPVSLQANDGKPDFYVLIVPNLTNH